VETCDAVIAINEVCGDERPTSVLLNSVFTIKVMFPRVESMQQDCSHSLYIVGGSSLLLHRANQHREGKTNNGMIDMAAIRALTKRITIVLVNNLEKGCTPRPASFVII
jgi:hypothetical protein